MGLISMNNYLSIDLESWAMPNIPDFLRLSSEEKKKLDSGNVKNSTFKILKLLRNHKTKITFFIVGQIYEWYPKLVEAIAEDGHEIAFHSHDHNEVTDIKSLIKNIQKSKGFIQKFKPVGFRAPRISLNHDYLKALRDYGFKYDSSSYGSFSARKKRDGIDEIPVSSISGIPVGSGYFIGLLGKKIEFIYKKLNNKNNPAIFFLHNWQILKPVNSTFPTIKYLLFHPHYFSYLADCSQTFIYLLKKFTFKPMKYLIT